MTQLCCKKNWQYAWVKKNWQYAWVKKNWQYAWVLKLCLGWAQKEGCYPPLYEQPILTNTGIKHCPALGSLHNVSHMFLTFCLFEEGVFLGRWTRWCLGVICLIFFFPPAKTSAKVCFVSWRGVVKSLKPLKRGTKTLRVFVTQEYAGI